MSRITINQLPEPVKRGQIQPKDYWNDDYFKQLEPLVAALKETVPDAKYDGKALVFLLVQLLNFQDQALGREAMPPKVCPKLPIKLVTDPSVGGALHAIALKVYDIRRQRGLKAIEWQNPGKRKECTEVFQVLRRELERRELLQPPRVFISPGCGSEVQRLREYVRRLQGQLVESPDEPGVTHMVYPFGPKGDPDDGKEYTTLLGIKGIQARVHYWYQPDSYDAWIPLHMVDNKEVVPERKPPGGVWKVTPRWIIDSERYNEWMNPADYTTPEMDAEMEAAEAADKGTKRAGSSLAGQSKKARGDTGPEVAAEPLEVLGPTARLRQVLQPHKALQDTGLNVDNLSMGQINNHLSAYKPPLPPQAPAPAPAAEAAAAAGTGADTAADTPGDTAAGTAAASGVPAPAGDAAAAQRQQQQPAGRPPPARSRPFGGIVSAAAAWFKPNALHPLERAALPEYFSGKNAETGVKLYRDHRDAMLALFWENPDRDLTFAEVRQHIDGEVNGLMRVYEFLQGWGLLNSSQGKNGMDMTLLMGPGVAARMAPGTSALYSFKKPSRLEATAAAQAGGPYGKAAESAAGGDGARLLHPVAGRKGTEEGLNPSCLTQIFCSAMPWVDCTRLRYHCTKLPDINLCPQAFAEGRFPPGVSSRDFVRIDDSKRHNSTDGWTPEETTLLLEAVELYKEDWERVASHVGKSQSACLARFVRLPIDEIYIDDVLDWTETLERSQQQQQQKLPPLPFLDEPNPLMATLGALSTILGPKVAAAAAQASLQALAEQDLTAGAVLDPQVRLTAVSAAGKQAAAANGQLGGEDGMDGIKTHPADQQQQQPADPSQPIDKQLMTSAVAAGLAAAATRAKLLAMAEEREIQRLMVGLVHDAAKRVDAKVNLLMQLTDPQGLDRERATIDGTLKSLASDRTAAAAQLVAARARKKQQDEAAAAAKAKTEAMKKQQAEAAARQKAAAAAAAAAQQQQQQQQQQQLQQQQQAAAAAAAGKPPAGSSPALQQQQQQQQQGLVAPPAAAPPSTQAGVPMGVPGGLAAGSLSQQQQQQVQQQQQQVQMQQQMQEQQLQQQQHTPAKSNVSMDSRGPGADSGMLDDDDDDLGELLDDIDGDGDVMLAGSGDEEMDMP